MVRKERNPAALLARKRWDKPGADRDQPRQAGKLGGRPAACNCSVCTNCKRRAKRQAKAAA